MRRASDAELREWMGAHTPRLLAVARSLASGPDEAEDILQEVWWKAYERAHARPAGVPLSAWLHMVTLNEGRSRLRRMRRRLRLRQEQAIESAVAADPEVMADADTLRNVALWRAIGELPRLQREVLLLRLVDDLSTAEAASAIGRAEGTVKASLHRALKKLRAILDEK